MAEESISVLRLRRTDDRSEHMLLNITRKQPDKFNLELIGTDKESLYTANIRDAEVKSLQASTFKGDLREWKSVLAFAFFHERPDAALPASLQGVEAVGAFSGDTATISIRRNTEGIHQKLGSIELEKNEEAETNTLEWADVAAAAADKFRTQMGSLQASVILQQDQVAKLTAELDNLVKAKRDHESELLSKFAALLNSKKLKIRDQQRLLGGAQVDLDTAEKVQDARLSSGRTSRRPNPSRRGKRRADTAPTPAEREDDDDLTEAGTVDEEDEDERRRQQATPETDEEDVDANDNHLHESVESHGTTTDPDDAQRTRRVDDRMEVDHPTSEPYDLPVGRRGKVDATEPTPPATSQMDDDDETDDEL